MRRLPLKLALTGVVGLSTILEWLAARRIVGLWIMPDEAIYGERGLGFWRTGHLSVVRGAGAGYSVLYPVLAGAPLSLGTPATGYALLKVVQALLVSLTAVPVFLYARRAMSERWALVAAALSVASPILLYAGFVMTEILAALVLPDVLGAYGPTLRAHYPIGLAAGLTWDHFAFLVLSTGVVPVVALALLLIRRVPDPQGRALVSVAAAAVLIVVLQVGIFASGYAPHLLGRDLAALPPILSVVFALWLSRVRAGDHLPVGAVAAAMLAALAITPWGRLVAPVATPDSFGVIIFQRSHPTVVILAVAAVLLVLLVTAPRLLPLVLLAALAASSVVASNRLAHLVRGDQANLAGTDHRWIDHAADGPVAELYDGERYWNGIWQATFWNRRLDEVVSLAPTVVPGPLAQKLEHVRPDGRLALAARYVVATDPHTFVGRPIAHPEETGLTLWRLYRPARLSMIVRGIQVSGDMTEPAHVTVYDCAGGRLELTLLPKSTSVVTVWLDGRVALRAAIGGLDYWNGTVFVPPSPTPRACHFVIDGQTLLGSTRVEFVRR